jgi:hypothetical protein
MTAKGMTRYYCQEVSMHNPQTKVYKKIILMSLNFGALFFVYLVSRQLSPIGIQFSRNFGAREKQNKNSQSDIKKMAAKFCQNC